MDKWALRTFRTDLSIFIDLLKTHRVTGDFKSYENLLSKLDTMAILEYKLSDLTFNLNGRIQGTLPDNLFYYQIFLDNTIYLKHSFAADDDAIGVYDFEINVHAYENNSKKGTCYKSSWHLDQHYDGNRPKYIHPSYHFQFGGKKIKNTGTGGLTILSTPRIPHPPLDVFLGFHFVLLNFFNWKQYTFVDTLLNDPDYQKIIKRAQERLWTPYFNAYNPSNIHNHFVMKNVFPLYMH